MRLKIKNIFAVLFVVSALSSCDDALDKFPLAALSPETYFKNATELQSYTNTFYGIMPSSSLFSSQDDVIIGYSLPDYMRGGRTVGSASWSWSYLRNFNTLIEYSTNCKDEAVRTKYIALTRFFRAYFYFEKVKVFGDVPWVDRALGSGDPELYKARDNREFVMTKIIEDIDFAIENLPANREVYTVTKWTALALKSRICLFEGTFRKYHAGAEMLETLPEDANGYDYYLTLAAEAADEFITSSGYRIYNDEGVDKSYRGLFSKNNATDISAEVILARNYSTTYGVLHNAGNYIVSGTIAKPGMTKKFVNSYLMKDGSRFTEKEGYDKMSFVEETKNRDPRFAQSVRTPGYTRPTESAERVSPTLECTVTGYSPTKYWTTEASEEYNKNDNDLIIFRAAEVYLNYAEAKAELGKLDQDDLNKAIKPLRDRVGMPNMILKDLTVDPYLTDQYTGYPKAKGEQLAAILEIRRERTIELVQEGHRYYDIVRWAEGSTLLTPLYGLYFEGPGSYDLDGDGVVDVILYKDEKPSNTTVPTYEIGEGSGMVTLSNGDSGYYEYHKNSKREWVEERDYLYAIPIDERTLTNGVLTQNPGWDDGLSFE